MAPHVPSAGNVFDRFRREDDGARGIRRSPGFGRSSMPLDHGPDEFEEVFELSETGKPFELYSRARLKRVR